jgi:hypothetical protein
MSDISIDVPAAYNLLEMISNLLLKYGVIKETLVKDSPLRSVQVDLLILLSYFEVSCLMYY